MSLQLLTILSPPPHAPLSYAHCARRRPGRGVAASLSGSASVLGFTSLPRVFANASGRIEFIIFLIMDWSFASGCSAGYEDLNDHNLLRLDPLFAVAVGKEDPLGSGRAPQDQGKALASASTLNRLELGNNKNSRCHKISADHHEAIEDTL